MDDVMAELNAAFEQVALHKWLPLVGKHTFRSVSFPLSLPEAEALLAANQHTRKVRGRCGVIRQDYVCFARSCVPLFVVLCAGSFGFARI